MYLFMNESISWLLIISGFIIHNQNKDTWFYLFNSKRCWRLESDWSEDVRGTEQVVSSGCDMADCFNINARVLIVLLFPMGLQII